MEPRAGRLRISCIIVPRRTIAVAVLAVIATAAAADRDARETAPPPAVFEDPCVDGSDSACVRRALDPLYAAFDATDAGTATAPVRISYLGDSVTADDLITNFLRESLQAKFGDGGPGFVYAAPPHEFCRQRAAKRTLGGDWNVHGVSASPPRDRLMGLGGSSADTVDGKLKLAVPTATLATADVYYLAQPAGGALEVATPGATATTIETRADSRQARFQSIAIAPGAQTITLRAAGRIRLFGVALEAATGVVVDNLGVVNATAKVFAANRQDHWKKQLAHRAPDLFVVMLGGNEAAWLPAKGAALDEHERLLGRLVETVRDANPDRACLVISPFDQLAWEDEGSPPRASVPAMVAAQRRAATAVGCAFWDAYQWMGGQGSSRSWRRRKWITNDFQHPTEAGSRRIADALAAGLLDGYAAWRTRNGKASASARR
jgi:lysophospholipase L1-like esterase